MINFPSGYSSLLNPSRTANTVGNGSAVNSSANTSNTSAGASGTAAGIADTSSIGGLVPSGERQDAATTASRILDFVASGIDQLRSQGASDSRLEQRLQAAREGVAKGYDQATDMLKAMGMLDDGLKADIAASRALVDKSLEDLTSLDNRAALLQQAQADALAAGTSATGSAATNSSAANSSANPVSGSRYTSSYSSRYSSSYSSSSSASLSQTSVNNSQQGGYSRQQSVLAQDNRMSMEVMTRDGDRVTVYFGQQSAMMSDQTRNGNSSSFSFAAMQGQSYQLSVEGQLDSGERDALNSLFEQAGNLASQFFGGDLGRALEQAMNLDYDATELASFSLELRQSTFAQRSRFYQPQPVELPTTELQNQKSPLLNYLDSYLSALEKFNTGPIADSASLLDDMVEQLMGSDDSRMPVFRDFNQALRQQLASQLQPTTTAGTNNIGQ
ncbi:DUF5610 domain-containing protein [Parathalassolituus penaei]|uniref:DUF5610 domain-containing protein n=1 Tax=Parathalassolituus penaei TaxID=2997323 RepID=A0A9X3IU98_9GAMM|nr:DUF5610 domain-containing protein [Parathalassolituus penaei]MCY0966744.1 DUF5610 domain-containing protein [Parathalassolituus penaei]